MLFVKLFWLYYRTYVVQIWIRADSLWLICRFSNCWLSDMSPMKRSPANVVLFQTILFCVIFSFPLWYNAPWDAGKLFHDSSRREKTHPFICRESAYSTRSSFFAEQCVHAIGSTNNLCSSCFSNYWRMLVYQISGLHSYCIVYNVFLVIGFECHCWKTQFDLELPIKKLSNNYYNGVRSNINLFSGKIIQII